MQPALIDSVRKLDVQTNKKSIKVQYGSYRIHELLEPSDLEDSTASYRITGYVITDLENHCISKVFSDFCTAVKEVKKYR